jgi:hypothetical protein
MPEYNKIIPKVSMNETGNRIYIDFGSSANSWIYGDSDVEIGLSDGFGISYIAIELKRKLGQKEQEDLKEAVGNESKKEEF